MSSTLNYQTANQTNHSYDLFDDESLFTTLCSLQLTYSARRLNTDVEITLVYSTPLVRSHMSCGMRQVVPPCNPK